MRIPSACFDLNVRYESRERNPSLRSRKRYIQQCLEFGPMRIISAQVLGMDNKWASIQCFISVRLRMLGISVNIRIDLKLVWQQDSVRPIIGVV